ncbi:TetR family transcriptional regulator [Actinomadura barringtoniae]|uniref:TetR family transcriptional regulator n=1 Tax=Actinomadura barringtoniae TaxID=1427535 RepID=A0A939PN13_9ACTN|nr:TetR/AcrR family transcriptional regulator [Actinomadura barringtoniae]MBO2452119.1 TetR family transcriptional regulator [Actinomadura barringtoniae]
MPARGDHEARRRDVSEAVWRVLAARGFGGLTLRAVAAEMNASTGLLTHYFPSKKALVAYALDVADERTASWDRAVAPAPGMAALRTALMDVLPLTPEAAVMNRVWVSSWDGSLGDQDLGVRETERYERWRSRLRPHVQDALDRGELPAGGDVESLTVTVAAFTHGLVVQALFDPDRFPAERQVAVLDDLLRSLAGGSAD